MIVHGSLFSGIGGFDLAAEWCGWKNAFHVEKEEFQRKILQYYWPNATSYEEIEKTDFRRYAGKIYVLSGGFPCQPWSHAGKRKGTEDTRDLWPEMLRAVREIQPAYVVAENVPGLISWEGGIQFERILSDLETEGYEVQPTILPALAVEAPHRRDRVWIVAYSCTNRRRLGENKQITKQNSQGQANPSTESKTKHAPHTKKFNDSELIREQKTRQGSELRNNPEQNFNTNPNSTRFKKQHSREESEGARYSTRLDSQQHSTDTSSVGQWREGNGQGKSKFTDKNGARPNWANFPTQPPVCGRDDGLSPKLDGLTVSNSIRNPTSYCRRKSIEGYGNAIVPEIAFQIFKIIDYLLKQ